MPSFWDTHAGAIQAVCAVIGVLGLGWYAVETSIIRRATLAQSDASRLPFFELVTGPMVGDHETTFLARTVTSAIALNVAWRFLGHPDDWHEVGACSQGVWQYLEDREGPVTDARLFLSGYGIAIRFTDTAGKRYEQVFRTDGLGVDLVVTTQIKALPGKLVERWTTEWERSKTDAGV